MTSISTHLNEQEGVKPNWKGCTACILTENSPNIRFNYEGIRNCCLGNTPIPYKGEFALRNLLDGYRGKGKECR
jgi:hypothetical protein